MSRRSSGQPRASALSREEVARLFGIIHNLRRQGLAIVYVSHHLSEVLEIADRVTVLRDGRKVATEEVGHITPGRLVEWMVGRSVSALYAERRARPGSERLRVEGLSRWGFFHDISFGVRAGEILGIGGLSGAGRSELARSISGIDPVDSGLLRLEGRPARLWHGGTEVRADGTPHRVRRRWGRLWNYDAAIEAGLAYLTEDRKTQGLALRMTLGENILASLIPRHCRWGVYSARRGAGLLGHLIGRLDVHPPEPRRLTSTLSGGNQQKALLAKWLATDPKVLFLDEPTRGVDVGAKAVIHRVIAEVADQGRCVVLISSDLPELVGLSDRILILRRGHLVGEIDKAHATEASVLLAANGGGETAPA